MVCIVTSADRDTLLLGSRCSLNEVVMQLCAGGGVWDLELLGGHVGEEAARRIPPRDTGWRIPTTGAMRITFVVAPTAEQKDFNRAQLAAATRARPCSRAEHAHEACAKAEALQRRTPSAARGVGVPVLGLVAVVAW